MFEERERELEIQRRKLEIEKQHRNWEQSLRPSPLRSPWELETSSISTTKNFQRAPMQRNLRNSLLNDEILNKNNNTSMSTIRGPRNSLGACKSLNSSRNATGKKKCLISHNLSFEYY